MGKMADYSMEDLGLFITLMVTACGGLLAVVFKSRCKVIRCCGASIEREVLHLKDEVVVSKPPLPQTLVPADVEQPENPVDSETRQRGGEP